MTSNLGPTRRDSSGSHFDRFFTHKDPRKIHLLIGKGWCTSRPKSYYTMTPGKTNALLIGNASGTTNSCTLLITSPSIVYKTFRGKIQYQNGQESKDGHDTLNGYGWTRPYRVVSTVGAARDRARRRRTPSNTTRPETTMWSGAAVAASTYMMCGWSVQVTRGGDKCANRQHYLSNPQHFIVVWTTRLAPYFFGTLWNIVSTLLSPTR
jgi:hypothetical protein